ncbi:MAG TPA: phosphate acyltransferase PlsX, partial [Lachnospiraceae bacterium]|nr:phosphate acyltransferase PlsX [Lachnospiraceae bacterium]
MGEMVKIAVDAMGGDFAPQNIVQGVVDALKEDEDIFVYLVGKEKEVNAELMKYEFDGNRVEVVNATEVIATEEPPVAAVRTKKDSSLVKALQLTKDGTADAFVSAGSSGAILVGGQLIVGRLRGVERSPFATFMPTLDGAKLILDCGANVDARPSMLVQWAKIGSIYYENTTGKKNPTVAIVNIGAEEEKGNALVKETYPLLKECKDINFTGSIESRDIPAGDADVVVCEAFVGNVILKLYEGLAKTLVGKIKQGIMSSFLSKIGGALVKPALKATLAEFDASEHGGAPLLGL